MKKVYLLILCFILFLLAGCGSEVNIVFETNGGTEIPAITEKNDFDPANLPSTTKEGYEFGGWYLDEECTLELIGNVPAELKFKLYAKWIPNEYDYKVEYYLEKLDGGYELEETLNLKGPFGEVVNAEVKTYAGFTLNDAESKKSTTIKATENEVLKMYYKRNTYKVIIDENGGNTVADLNLKFGESVVLPTLTRVGYEFTGWENAVTTMPANDVTVKALWNALEVNYTIEIYHENANDDNYILFSSETKKALTDSTVKHDEPLHSQPQEFILNDDHPNSILEAVVKGDGSTVLKIYYNRAKVTVEFDYMSDKPTETKEFKFGASNYLPNPGEKVGHEFIEWVTTSGVAATTVPFTGLETYKVYASWRKLSYTISFETNANISVTSITALYDTEISAPTAPVRQGYNFLGWYTDTTYTKAYTFTKMEAKNITLYAKWEGLPYTIEFNSNGGSIVESITQPIDSEVTKPIPTKEGYDFVNWYKDAALTQVYNDWKMPYNGLKLYAKWDAKTYTITFNTDGGSAISDITAKYLSEISAPLVNPTKEGFIFGGYYKDADFEEEFIFNVMPLGGATVYVKWLDESYATSIANVLMQDPGSEVVVKGLVYCVLDPAYYGYFLYDSTGQIFIHAPNADVNIGDMLLVTGRLTSGVTVSNVTDVEVESTGNQVKAPTYTTLAELYDLLVISENYYKYSYSVGILKKNPNNGMYYLQDNTAGMIIDNKSSNFSKLEDYKNKLVSISYAFDIIDRHLIVVAIEEVEDEEVILNFLKEYIFNKYDNLFFESGEEFSPIETDEFGLGTLITYTAIGQNADAYDSDLKKFDEDVEENIEVTFKVEITLGSSKEEFEFIVEVGKELLPLSTVREFYNGEYGVVYLLEVVIVLMPSSYMYVAKDDTGYVFIEQDLDDVRVGDVVRLYAYKEDYDDYAYMTCTLVEILDREVDIELEPKVLDPATFNETVLDLDYGEYVETVGYLEAVDETYNYLNYFDCNGVKYYIAIYDYDNTERIKDYLYYPVNFRFYVLKFGDQVELLYAGIREDIKFPKLSVTEELNAVHTTFTNRFAGKTFYPFDTFEIITKDLVYGVDIEYEFSEASKPYFVDGRFINVDEEVPIVINFKLSKDGQELNFAFSTKLLPLPITKIDEVIAAPYDGIVFVKGLVVFASYNYIIIQDETGYIRFDGYGFNAYLGDYVLVCGRKYEYDFETYLIDAYLDIPNIIEIYSRGNEVEIDFVEYSIEELYEIKIDYFVGYFVEILGELKYSSGLYTLTDGINTIKISAVDGYTEKKLEAYEGKIITFKGYLGFNDGETWFVYYLGDDLVATELSSNQKIDRIKAWILENYNGKFVDADSGFSLLTEFTTLGGTVTYSSLSDLVEITPTYLYTEDVEEFTTVTINAVITVGTTNLEIEFEITIIPYGEDVKSPITDIIDVYDIEVGEQVRVVGTILAQNYYDGYYYFLIQDETGMLYYRLPTSTYIYSHTEGRIMDGIGVVKYALGRKYVEGSSIVYSGYDSLNVTFAEVTFVDIFNMDRHGANLVGMPIEITGKYDGNYISNGYQRVLVAYPYVDYYSLYQYMGYNVTLRGFYFGYGDTAIITTTNIYQYSPYIKLAPHSDEEKVEIARRDLQNKLYMYGPNYDTGSEFYLDPTHALFNDVTYIYNIVGESPAYIQSNYLYMVNTGNSYNIDLLIEIKCGSITEIVEFTFNVIIFSYNNLEDLFYDESETKVIILLGEVVVISDKFIYFLIEGKIYYLELYDFHYYLNVGDIVRIEGQKYKIDGVVDYTFNIYVTTDYSYTYEYIEPVITTRTVTQIYTDYEDGVNLKDHVHNVTGLLGYDANSDMFFIEENGRRIYIRDSYMKIADKMAKGEIVPMNGYNLGNKIYIGEVVDMELLFPNKVIYGDSLVFDIYNIELAEMSAEENLEHALADIKSKVEGMLFYPGDYFYSEFDPKHIHSPYYNLWLTIEVKNEEDMQYFTEYYSQISVVEEETVVTMLVTLEDIYYEGELIKTIEVDVRLMPYPITSIRDVLYSEPNAYYMIEGTVQQFQRNMFIILKDDTGTIYIDASLPEEFDLAVGDKLVVFGYRSMYDYSNASPILVCYQTIKNKGVGDPINNVATPIDVAGIYDINHHLPDGQMLYVSFTGKVIFTGSYNYPAHALLEDDENPDFAVEIEGPTYPDFQNNFKQYQGMILEVTGWIMLKSTYSKFMWDIIYDSHKVISNEID